MLSSAVHSPIIFEKFLVIWIIIIVFGNCRFSCPILIWLFKSIYWIEWHSLHLFLTIYESDRKFEISKKTKCHTQILTALYKTYFRWNKWQNQIKSLSSNLISETEIRSTFRDTIYWLVKTNVIIPSQYSVFHIRIRIGPRIRSHNLYLPLLFLGSPRKEEIVHTIKYKQQQ